MSGPDPPTFYTKSLLCIDVQNHSEKPLYYSSMNIELSDGKTMVPQIDAFDGPLPSNCVINPGDSLGSFFDFADIIGTAKGAGASIKAVVAKDKIGREFLEFRGHNTDKIATHVTLKAGT